MIPIIMYIGLPLNTAKVVSEKDIILFRRGFGQVVFSNVLFLPPDYHIGIMTFPGVETDKSRRRSQQMNYETFINTMAEFMQKYRE